MSGSGGYYKYRCKYWLTYNCPNWVWVNNAACAHCLADGRDSDEAMMTQAFRLPKEVSVPQLENGLLQYMIREIVASSDMDRGWSVKEFPLREAVPIATGPSAVSFGATDGPEELGRPGTGIRKQALKRLSFSRASVGVD